jgi:hypothetical protein
MRRSSDDGERLQGALAAIDDALFGGSPKDRFDVERPNPRASDLKTLNQRIRNLDEFYSRAVAEIKALRK